MQYSIGELSAAAGVTVRTLHHYDSTGLLSPGGRSPAGYRRYGDADLARLRQILFYRELGFPLEEIAAILHEPDTEVLDHLRARRRRLSEQIERLAHLVEMTDRAIDVQRTGVRLTAEERSEVFGEISFDLSYATESDLRRRDTEGHRTAMARAAAHTKDDWRVLMRESAAWRRDLIAAHDDGCPVDSEQAMDVAEEHRRHTARWFTPCPPAMHVRIADDFVRDPRAFALVVPPSQQRPGLAAYLRDAIRANADRADADPDTPSGSTP
ncbi:MerR family transcriptional regulator [Streptomyces beihaiensis]|uniref:MerR family transcriptional regulator n=1 Tax=Streptomyces beihaiensis TaxID=2984495 RepID=A0ABT3U4H7_9ACTN|nr:MerR family transcriptional regulator [Streptomyces beihaiensis]MCX3063088.1 MerR family transcriptional regulator [Streptomyces beihaiensis]